MIKKKFNKNSSSEVSNLDPKTKLYLLNIKEKNPVHIIKISKKPIKTKIKDPKENDHPHRRTQGSFAQFFSFLLTFFLARRRNPKGHQGNP